MILPSQLVQVGKGHCLKSISSPLLPFVGGRTAYKAAACLGSSLKVKRVNYTDKIGVPTMDIKRWKGTLTDDIHCWWYDILFEHLTPQVRRKKSRN